MAKVVFHKDFAKSRAGVKSDRVRANVDKMLHLIEAMPGVGSSLVPDWMKRVFGPNIRRAIVSPYEIIYEYNASEDTVFVYSLMYGPNIH